VIDKSRLINLRATMISMKRRRDIRCISTVATAAALALMLTPLVEEPSEARAAETVKAPTFLAGVWATADGCKRQAAIDAGGPKSVETTPEILTSEGYKGWEGGCTFSSIKEDGAGKWTVATQCTDAAEEWKDTEKWELDSAAGLLKVTVEDKTTEFVRCDAGKGN
jgi:hypothetical protein